MTPLNQLEPLMVAGREDELIGTVRQDPSLATQVFGDGVTLLILAARYGLRSLVAELVARGADLNRVDGAGHSPLHAALESRVEDGPHATAILKDLLSSGANPNVFGYLGHTPLTYALSHHLVPETKALLVAGADPNLPRKLSEEQTPLVLAASWGEPELLDLLRKYGATY